MSLVHATPRAATATSSPHQSAATLFPVPAASASHVGDTRHLEQLERAVTIALAPFDYADAAGWADALSSALCVLGNANTGAFLLPGGPLLWHAVALEPDAEHAEASGRNHDEATERLHAGDFGDLVRWARDDLAEVSSQPPLAPTTSGTVGIRVRTSAGTVAAVCVHRDRSFGPAPLHLLAAFRAIAPAFRAGVAAWAGANACRSNVSQMLDSLADPALLFDITGTRVHANPATGRLASPVDSARIEGEAQRIAWALGAMARRRTPSAEGVVVSTASRTVQVAGLLYRLRGSIVGEQVLGAQSAVLVTITATAAEPLSDEALEAEYGLTARETQVARLIAEGLSNNEIATRLGVRFFTARNHVERTLAKLGVASRQRVGPLLRNEGSEPVDGSRASAA